MFKKICFYAVFICISGLMFNSADAVMEENAVKYHKKALELIAVNDIDQAVTFLQKAVELDPYFVEAHNDLGVAYEKKANLNKARHHYLKAINIQPDFAPAYLNLSMLEESMGNIDEAVFYWKARIVFGGKEDKWGKQAAEKLREYSSEEISEGSTRQFVEEVLKKMDIQQSKKDEIALKHFEFGKKHFQEAEYIQALEEFKLSKRLQYENKEMDRFIRESNIAIMQEYFAKAIEYYRQKDYDSAKYNFNKITQMLSENN